MSRTSLKTILKESLNGAERVAVLGVGSELKGDDRAGMMVVEHLQKKCDGSDPCSPLRVFYGATAPENLTGEIKKYRPTHLVIIDSADVSQEPGTIEVISPELVGGISFSTHMMPIKILVDYLYDALKCKIMIIGIQPKTLEYSAALSPEVRTSVRQVASAIDAVVNTRQQ